MPASSSQGPCKSSLWVISLVPTKTAPLWEADIGRQNGHCHTHSVSLRLYGNPVREVLLSFTYKWRNLLLGGLKYITEVCKPEEQDSHLDAQICLTLRRINLVWNEKCELLTMVLKYMQLMWWLNPAHPVTCNTYLHVINECKFVAAWIRNHCCRFNVFPPKQKTKKQDKNTKQNLKTN